MRQPRTYTRQAIVVIGFLLFLGGFFLRDITEVVIPVSQADLAGMNWTELKNDYDFTQAVQKVVERDCSVDVEDGSLSC